MNLTQEIKNKLIYFIENCNDHIGKSLYFQEALSTDKNKLDRHCTTFSSTEFIVTTIGVRTSGARLVFSGGKLMYEIAMDLLTHFEENKTEIQFIETYSDKVYRITKLKITD